MKNNPNYIIMRHITTCNQIDYFNGKNKSIWTYNKNEAITFTNVKSAEIAKNEIIKHTFETYPLIVIKLKTKYYEITKM
jgi:hypothetical protein